MAGAPTPDNNLTREVRELQKRVRDLEHRQTVSREPNRLRRRDSWIAETYRRPDEAYPTSGNVLPFRFLDCHFTNALGTQNIDQFERSPYGQVLARTFDDGYYPEQTRMRLERLRGLGGSGAGEWWAFPVASRAHCAAYRNETLTLITGGSYTPLELDTLYATSSDFTLDTATEQLTAPGGAYRVSFEVEVVVLGAANATSQVYVSIEGASSLEMANVWRFALTSPGTQSPGEKGTFFHGQRAMAITAGVPITLSAQRLLVSGSPTTYIRHRRLMLEQL